VRRTVSIDGSIQEDIRWTDPVGTDLLRIKQTDYPLSFFQRFTGDFQSALDYPSQDAAAGHKAGCTLSPCVTHRELVRQDLFVQTSQANRMNLD
jgi:hypothetical protein